jgi:hypothetical protein
MSAKQKLIAAAEKVERQAKAASPMPWQKGRGTTEVIAPNAEKPFGAVGGFVASTYGHLDMNREVPDADLIVTAVNAMPALAAWLRWEAEAACVPEHSRKALTVADAILGGPR